jgi:DNA primase
MFILFSFPIRNKYRQCLGIGRRDISKKRYIYPINFIKPLYGIYELPTKIQNLWIVEGPFNLWSLHQWRKNGVALLGTGTKLQYEELLNVDTNNFILALDPDEAGRNGTKKIIQFLLQHHKYNIYVALIPEGKDVNDLTENEFNGVEVVPYKVWRKII